MCPSFVLTAQGSDQTLGEIQPSGASFGLIDGSLLVVLCLLELLVELCEFRVQLPDDFLHLIELHSCDFELLLGIFQLLTKGSHFLDDVPELDDIEHPRAKTGSCFRLVLNDLRIELRIGEVILLDRCDVGWWEFIVIDDFFEAKQGCHEGLRVFHQLLRGFPVECLGFLGLVGVDFLVETGEQPDGG